MNQSPYKVYCRYCAIKAHLYTKGYNILRYSKRISQTEKAFEKRMDSRIFHVIANKVDYKILDHWLVANLAYRNIKVPFDLVRNLQLSNKVYERWRKNIAFIKENYVDDLKTAAEASNWSWKRMLQFSETDYPIPFSLVYGQRIAVESWCLLDSLTGLSRAYEKKVQDGLFSLLTLKYSKYRMLLNVEDAETAKMTPRHLEMLKG